MVPPKFDWGSFDDAQAPAKAANGKFAWDDHQDAEMSAPPEQTTMGQAALEHYGNSATLGYLPQMQAMAEKLTPDPNADVNARLKAQGFNIQEPQRTYVGSRDANLRRLALEDKEHPIASGAGKVGGMVADMLIPAGAVAKEAGLGAKVLQGAKIGAAFGAAANPGDTEGEVDPLQFGARAKGTAVGAAIGGTIPVVAKGIEVGAGGLADYLKNKAALKATRALGRPTPTQAARMAESGQDLELGRSLLDQGAIPVLGTPDRIASRVDALKENAGQKISDLIDQAEAEAANAPKVEYTPVRFKKGAVEMQTEVRATPVRFDENPAKRAFPWLSDRDAPPIMTRGEEQPVQAALYSNGPHYETTGAAKIVPGTDTAGKIDAKKLANTIRKSADFAEMKTTPGMESTVAAIEKQLGTLEANGQMSLKDAQKLRQGIDRSINFNKAAPDMRGAQEGLYQQRTAIRDAMNDAVNQLSPGAGKDALLKANRSYGNLSTASDILDREVGRNQANRSVSLADTIAGAAGLAHGGPIGAAVLGGLNKAGRAFGNSMQARGYDALANKLPAVARAASAANANPMVAQVLAQRASQGAFGPSDSADQEDSGPQKLGSGQGAQPNRAPSGQDRWAQQGAQSLKLQDEDAARLMSSPKGKQLLIQASDLKPGSKAMQNINAQIQAILKGAK